MKRVLQLIFSGSLLLGELAFGSAVLRILEQDELLWSWPNSLYFCFTAVTTIGYGNFTPEASASHYFMVAFLVIGIPTLFCFVALLSDMFSTWNSQLVTWLLERLSDMDLRLPVARRTVAWLNLLLAGFWLFAIVVLSSILVVHIGGVPFSFSLYFVVVSYTTVGFGEINPYNMDAYGASADNRAESITPTQLSLFITMTFVGLCSVGTTMAALQGYLQLILDKTCNTASMMFPAAFRQTVETDGSGLDRSQSLWLNLVGYQSGIMRLWDMERGISVLQLDSSASHLSTQGKGGEETEGFEDGGPGSVSLQIHVAGARDGQSCEDGPGPPVMCCILQPQQGRRNTGGVFAISAHAKGSLCAWSVTGNCAHLVQANVLDAGEAARAMTPSDSMNRIGRGNTRLALLCAASDSERIFTGDSHGHVGRWRLQFSSYTGNGSWEFSGANLFSLEASVRCLSVLPGGRRLLAGGGDETFFSFKDTGVVLAWDLVMDVQVFRMDNIRQGPVVAAVELDDDEVVATAHLHNAAALIWDVGMSPIGSNAPKPLMVLEGHAGPVSCLSPAPGLGLLISGSKDRTVAVWDTQLGQPLSVLTGHSGAVTSALVLPGGLTSGAEPGLGSFLSINSGSSSYMFSNMVKDSPKLCIVSVSEDGSFKLWERQELGMPFVHQHTFYVPGDDMNGALCSAAAFVPSLTEAQRRVSRSGSASLLWKSQRRAEESKRGSAEDSPAKLVRMTSFPNSLRSAASMSSMDPNQTRSSILRRMTVDSTLAALRFLSSAEKKSEKRGPGAHNDPSDPVQNIELAEHPSEGGSIRDDTSSEWWQNSEARAPPTCQPDMHQGPDGHQAQAPIADYGADSALECLDKSPRSLSNVYSQGTALESPFASFSGGLKSSRLGNSATGHGSVTADNNPLQHSLSNIQHTGQDKPASSSSLACEGGAAACGQEDGYDAEESALDEM